jgi:YjjG family noncanonical pyrimidine nucleotidase
MFQNTIKDIFFDLDHTLWDFDKNSEMAFDAIFKKDHPTMLTKDFIKVYAPINQACWKLYQVDKMTHEELRYKRLKQSFDALHYTITDAQIETISNEYIEYLPNFNHLFDDTHEVLTYLKTKYKLHIITNGFANVQDRKMTNSNINHYFETTTNSELAGAKKPNPVIFDYALNMAKANKKESIMIGDCIEADVKGALHFGMNAIFFNPNGLENEEGIHEITTLASLKNIF